MPLSGPSSYVPTLDEFLAHWALTNAQLGAGGPMVLVAGPANAPENVPLATLTTLRGAIDSAQETLQVVANTVEIKRGQLALDKRSLLDAAQSFGRKVRALFPGASPYAGALPELPILSAGKEAFIRPMRDLRDIWERVDAETTPVVLPSGEVFVDFNAAVVALETRWQEVNTAEVQERVEREKRNSLQVRAEGILGRYRPMVEALLAPETPLVSTIPRLRPAPGRTPDAVALTAVWDAALGKARLAWEPSADADLAGYQVRMSPTAQYDADLESVIANTAAGDPREVLTIAGLAGGGDSACYKVYVVLTTGNEAGSNAATLMRP